MPNTIRTPLNQIHVLLSIPRQVIIWTDVSLLLIRPLEANLGDI